MAKQPKLNDLQLVLLSTASQREDGNLLPLAGSVAGYAARTRKAIESLLKCGFAAEADTPLNVPSWRDDGDRPIGAFITAEGKAAIGADDVKFTDNQMGPAAPPPPAPVAPARKRGEIRAGTKQALLVDMLERREGASIQEIVDTTGWLPHTTRAALTVLKKRGLEITREKVEGVGRYRAQRAAR